MNVFVLSTGRCGSTTFSKACSHLTNYTSAHESRIRLCGDARLDYPGDHIESDNRLSWMLGRLERRFGSDAFYVHLMRDREKVVQSFLRRWGKGIIKAYEKGILMGATGAEPIDVCVDYIHTATTNIEVFLEDKPKKMSLELENASEQFPKFLERIEAEGDLKAAVAEWSVKHNASKKKSDVGPTEATLERPDGNG